MAETSEPVRIADYPRRHESDVAWDRLIHYPGNARHSDIPAIVESLETNGWFGALIVQESTGHILIGNGRTEAARDHVGLPACPEVQWLDCDDDAARRINLMDNRSQDLATYADEMLAAQLTELADTEMGFVGTGYDANTLDLLTQSLAAEADQAGGYGEIPDDVEPTHTSTEDYEVQDIRSIVLPYAGEDFDQVVRKLIDLRREFDLETNAQVVYKLVMEAMD